jgi:hypothetical protein
MRHIPLAFKTNVMGFAPLHPSYGSAVRERMMGCAPLHPSYG